MLIGAVLSVEDVRWSAAKDVGLEGFAVSVSVQSSSGSFWLLWEYGQ